LAQKINYILIHIVITVVTHFLGQKVELKQDLKLFNKRANFEKFFSVKENLYNSALKFIEKRIIFLINNRQQKYLFIYKKKSMKTSILNNINQYLVILPTENIFILVILFT
jgi:hypothetical protein